MNVFELNRNLINDYYSYIKSFIRIKDKRIDELVQKNLDEGLLWPDPLIQLNPAFEEGAYIDELVRQNIIHPECSNIFRINKKTLSLGQSMRLYKHQLDSIYAANAGDNYILTTGTSSGKSLSYIIPIVNHVLRNKDKKGVKAIIIYPMNALANSQCIELQKFLCDGYPDGKGPVSFARYTGQEPKERRQEIIGNPPDIILTNYVMLELILTRPHDLDLSKSANNLQFLVLDEMHTYRGRQGADVAMLIRRVKDICGSDIIQCVGTSATVAGMGSYEKVRSEVARVATLLFGSLVKPDRIIGETLKRITRDVDLTDSVFIKELTERIQDQQRKPPEDCDGFINDPMSIWLESTFGVTTEVETGRLKRSISLSITGEEGASVRLSKLTGLSDKICEKAIQEGLLAGYRCMNPSTNLPVFAFKIHQFISRGDTVYSTVEKEEDRYITVYGQKYVPHDRNRILLPLAFCRECGQEYYIVKVSKDLQSGQKIFHPRKLGDRTVDFENEMGYIYISSSNPWEEDNIDRLPDDWVEDYKGEEKIKQSRKKYLPQKVFITPDAKENNGGILVYYIPSRFNFCLNCGISYGIRQLSEFTKLAPLGLEGRSTATTILSLSTIRYMNKMEDLHEKARKLLSFTDNRQDASLQAGHFNDFIEMSLLRAGVYLAVKNAGSSGVRHEDLALKVFDALDLSLDLYASDPTVRRAALDNTKIAFRNVLGYLIYRDLKRGWRVMAPNLEQCGLLEIKYPYLDELCETEDDWQHCHEALLTAKPETRFKIAKVLLDFMRRELAIKVDYLTRYTQERIWQQSSQHLREPWFIEDIKTMEYASILYPRPKKGDEKMDSVYLSPRSGFGQYLRRTSTFTEYKNKLSMDDTLIIISQLLKILHKDNFVEIVEEPSDKDDAPGYQLPASAMLWTVGDGKKAFHDPIRIPRESSEGGHTNKFFINFYTSVAKETKALRAREHTAQVTSEERQKREEYFREGHLPILYCSPTMELGIDIAQLNAVNMRNIPPTPANYAQRSGRAGRSGQPALVFSYCSTGSSHDQYFFKRPHRMVTGSVTTPRMDLANRDLIKSHIHAIWLAETHLDLGSSLKDILDLSGENPTLELFDSVKDHINAPQPRQGAFIKAKKILNNIMDELIKSDWYSDKWLEEILLQIPHSFNQACNRWRELYLAALKQREIQNKIIGDASRSYGDIEQAKRLRREAETQLELLRDTKNIIQSDFYSYRYFASEGFLPGYNFPRLPLSAFIPARKRFSSQDEYVSRPRFLAITEFGPRSIIYHEGAKYIVNKVIMPLEKEGVATCKVKLCPDCGYLHPIFDGDGPDLCQYCGTILDLPLRQLLRLHNVSTKRRDRISSDEEERLRFGYELKTAIRFNESNGRPTYRTGNINNNGRILGKFIYGQSATLWRINIGWKRREEKNQFGFVLDTERGYWGSNKQADVDEDSPDNISSSTIRVIPYVEDYKNCLIFEPSDTMDEDTMASLQSALKQGIQVRYQLEDSELACEILPDRIKRRQILFYESTEGGAGVLRHLIDDPSAINSVAREALSICHFDPVTGDDKRKAGHAKEECEAACYDCLMSYSNQSDHKLLDRLKIKDILMELSSAQVIASPVEIPRAKHLEVLNNQTGSELEKEWLKYLEENNYNLPSKAQYLVKACNTCPDFFYEDQGVAIYIDGPVHNYPDTAKKDIANTEAMEDYGYNVIRFGEKDEWENIISQYPNVFGKKNR